MGKSTTPVSWYYPVPPSDGHWDVTTDDPEVKPVTIDGHPVVAYMCGRVLGSKPEHGTNGVAVTYVKGADHEYHIWTSALSESGEWSVMHYGFRDSYPHALIRAADAATNIG